MAFDISEFFSRHPNPWSDEARARLVGDDPEALLWRLKDCVSCLSKGTRTKLAHAKFDFENKRLVGDGVALQWKLRERPDDPVSYRNQQTNIGIVVVELVDRKDK